MKAQTNDMAPVNYYFLIFRKSFLLYLTLDLFIINRSMLVAVSLCKNVTVYFVHFNFFFITLSKKKGMVLDCLKYEK